MALFVMPTEGKRVVRGADGRKVLCLILFGFWIIEYIHYFKKQQQYFLKQFPWSRWEVLLFWSRVSSPQGSCLFIMWPQAGHSPSSPHMWNDFLFLEPLHIPGWVSSWVFQSPRVPLQVGSFCCLFCHTRLRAPQGRKRVTSFLFGASTGPSPGRVFQLLCDSITTRWQHGSILRGQVSCWICPIW